MAKKKVHRNIGGVVKPAYANEFRAPYDGNPQKGMEGAALNRSGQPVDKAAAGELAAKIRAERRKRIEQEGHA